MSKRSLVKKRWIKALTASMTDNANVKVFEVIKNNNKLFISETPQLRSKMTEKELEENYLNKLSSSKEDFAPDAILYTLTFRQLVELILNIEEKREHKAP